MHTHVQSLILCTIVDVLNIEEVSPTAVLPSVHTVYVLPNTPLDIKLSIERHSQGQYFENRRRVVQWLYNDLCSYKMSGFTEIEVYPGKLYEEAARALISKYPNLSDTTGTGYISFGFTESWLSVFFSFYLLRSSLMELQGCVMCMQSGTQAQWLNSWLLQDSWREALRFKAKYERSKLRKADESEGLPEKRPRQEMRPALPRRMTRPTAVANMADGEDEESIAAHIAGMCKERHKASPNHEYLSDCMKRTFADRRGWIASEIPSVKDVLEKYPALSTNAIGVMICKEEDDRRQMNWRGHGSGTFNRPVMFASC
ncbi:uncharacterized protein [Dermacentor albipictus]|uniref:uncharacterized protein n=1 Tax=Dermacentor albipictus TaxID=60249 RepID=UPI0038FC4552